MIPFPAMLSAATHPHMRYTPSTRQLRHNRGVTLLELVVTLAVMGIVFLIVSTALPQPVVDDRISGIVPATRSTAISSGNAQAALITQADTARPFSALPDGRVIADSTVGIDQLTGRTANAR